MYPELRSGGHTNTPLACVRLADETGIEYRAATRGSGYPYNRSRRSRLGNRMENIPRKQQPGGKALGDVVINNENHQHHQKYKPDLEHRLFETEAQVPAHHH